MEIFLISLFSFEYINLFYLTSLYLWKDVETFFCIMISIYKNFYFKYIFPKINYNDRYEKIKKKKNICNVLIQINLHYYLRERQLYRKYVFFALAIISQFRLNLLFNFHQFLSFKQIFLLIQPMNYLIWTFLSLNQIHYKKYL